MGVSQSVRCVCPFANLAKDRCICKETTDRGAKAQTGTHAREDTLHGHKSDVVNTSLFLGTAAF